MARIFTAERDYLITVDYYSNFFEIDMCENTRDTTVIKKLKAQFARHGIPDDGPQFTADGFEKFARVEFPTQDILARIPTKQRDVHLLKKIGRAVVDKRERENQGYVWSQGARGHSDNTSAVVYAFSKDEERLQGIAVANFLLSTFFLDGNVGTVVSTVGDVLKQLEKLPEAAGLAVLCRTDLEGANPCLMSDEEPDADDCYTWLAASLDITVPYWKVVEDKQVHILDLKKLEKILDKCKEAVEKNPKSRKGTKRVLSDLPSSAATPTKVNRAYVKSRMEEETAGGSQMESDEIGDGDQGSNERDNETKTFEAPTMQTVCSSPGCSTKHCELSHNTGQRTCYMLDSLTSVIHYHVMDGLNWIVRGEGAGKSDPPVLPLPPRKCWKILMNNENTGKGNDMGSDSEGSAGEREPCRNILHKIWKKVESCKEGERNNLLKMPVCQVYNVKAKVDPTRAQRRSACPDMSPVRLGIEPGSLGSQSDDLPLHHPTPHVLLNGWENTKESVVLTKMMTAEIESYRQKTGKSFNEVKEWLERLLEQEQLNNVKSRSLQLSLKPLKKKVTDARRRSSGKEKLRQLCEEPCIPPNRASHQHLKLKAPGQSRSSLGKWEAALQDRKRLEGEVKQKELDAKDLLVKQSALGTDCGKTEKKGHQDEKRMRKKQRVLEERESKVKEKGSQSIQVSHAESKGAPESIQVSHAGSKGQSQVLPDSPHVIPGCSQLLPYFPHVRASTYHMRRAAWLRALSEDDPDKYLSILRQVRKETRRWQKLYEDREKQQREEKRKGRGKDECPG
ncbi:hypothetical protein Bbelb_035680 [Branchiostoma belcheri]|nr:hypothetical protein Bbelb_035680 [Branchiostoma belcheri]